MPRVLFDHNVPAPLRHSIVGCEVRTADEEGWGQIANGELIAMAESKGFEILITCDQNLAYQQNLAHRNLSIIVLGGNIWPRVQLAIPRILEALSQTAPGSFEFIDIPSGKRVLRS